MNKFMWERIEVKRKFLLSDQWDPGAGSLWKGLTELMAQAESVAAFKAEHWAFMCSHLH